MMIRTLGVAAVLLSVGLAGLVAGAFLRGMPMKQAAPVAKAAAPPLRRDRLLVRVVDASGSPVSGARVGAGAYASSKDPGAGWQFFVPRAESDAAGMAELMSVKAIEREETLLYVLQDRLRLAGFKEVSRDDLGATVTVTLEPACRVRGRLKSSGMAGLKRPIGWTNVYLHRGAQRPLSFSSESGEYQFDLPPGTYKLSAYGTDLDTVETRIEVKKGMGELEAGPDGPAPDEGGRADGASGSRTAADRGLEERRARPAGGPAGQGRRARLLGLLVRAVPAGHARARWHSTIDSATRAWS